MKSNGSFLSKPTRLVGFFLLAISLYLVGCATTGEKRISEETVESESRRIEKEWGIKVLSVRLTAADHMIDFRYRILDPEKASTLVQKGIEPYLIDQATGTKLSVPRTRLGPMRQSAVKPDAGRNYIILFGNTGKLVKPGSHVTVVIGEFRIEDLVVE